MRETKKKATFSLHPDVLDGLDKAMAHGAASSKNALVERALIRELEMLKKQERLAKWTEGAKDPLLLKDVADIEASFSMADDETARTIQ